ncbi:MAG: Outer membrane protein [Rhodospirillaceae bacterium]|nr:MAG: Outer membrane protein [Rhodospirillaceae bacterium]
MTTGLPSDSNPTYSTDRWSKTLNLGLSWNILDSGVSYFKARQNTDRALIAMEHRCKAVHTLAAEVRSAFWRAAAY